MTQRMPVVRELHWRGRGLLPQFIAIVLLAGLVHLVLPHVGIPIAVFMAAVTYKVFCQIMRARFARDQKIGMRAYQAHEFQDAIIHFERSYRFFSAHRRLDKWRSLLFGVASPNPYRVMALCNMAYCFSQMGDGRRAIEMYEQVLREKPDCALARASLNVLHSVSSASNAAQAADK